MTTSHSLQSDVRQRHDDVNLQRHRPGSIASDAACSLSEAEYHPCHDPGLEDDTENLSCSLRVYSLHRCNVAKEDFFSAICRESHEKTVCLNPAETTQLPGLVMERHSHQFLILKLFDVFTNLLPSVRVLKPGECGTGNRPEQTDDEADCGERSNRNMERDGL